MGAEEELKTLLRQAEEAVRNKQWTQAVKHAMEAVSVDGQCLQGYMLLGKAYLKRREYDGAYAAFKRALQIDPDNVRACRNLYKVCVHIRDYNDAIVLLEQLVRLDPSNAEYKRSLKELYLRTGRTEEAMELGREAEGGAAGLDEPAESETNLDNRALISGIRRAISARKWGDAARQCRAALAMNPQNLKAKILLAYIEFKRRRTQTVIDLCREVLHARPDHVLAKEYLALSYIKQREWAKAGELLEELMLLDADELNAQPFGLKKEEVVANLALTYEKRNLVRTAQMTYEKLLQGNVKFPAVNKRLEKLEVPLARVSTPKAEEPAAVDEPPIDDAVVEEAIGAEGATPQSESGSAELPEAPEPGTPPPAASPHTPSSQWVQPALETPVPEPGPLEADVETQLCSHCDREVPAIGEFCPFCGGEFEGRQACVHCGAMLPGNAMFCPECGRNQQVAQFTCFHCGSASPTVDHYCQACGSLLIQSCPGADEVAEYLEGAEALLAEGRRQDAIDQLKRAVLQHPNQAAAAYALALLLEMIQKVDDALNQYRKVIEMPADPLILGEACRRLGILLIFTQRRASEALEPLERGARLLPGDPGFHYVMGLAYMSMGEMTKAMRALNKIVEFDPTNALAYAAIARIYARGNRGNEAAQYYNDAISLLRLTRGQVQLPDLPQGTFDDIEGM